MAVVDLISDRGSNPRASTSTKPRRIYRRGFVFPGIKFSLFRRSGRAVIQPVMNNDRFRTPNPAIHRTCTVLFDSVAHLDSVMRGVAARRAEATVYGTFGTPTTHALAEAVLSKEGGAGVAFAPSGLGAVTLALLSVVANGHHLLVPDNVYGPTRQFCDTVLQRLGVSTEYYQPGIGGGISDLITQSTSTVFVESPGSYTFEIEDVPALVASVRRTSPNVTVIMDNAWGSPGLFKPFDHDVDISIVPLTKYWGGHADLLVGAVVAGPRSWSVVRDTATALGVNTNGDEAYLTLRGARSVDMRIGHHERSGLDIAQWLTGHSRIGRVLHPALPSFPGHAMWKRDFAGSNGLFSFELLDASGDVASVDQVAHFVDALVSTGHFGLGYSWGGFESLVMPAVLPGGPNIVRTASSPSLDNLIRLHIGLEPVAGLRSALEQALSG